MRNISNYFNNKIEMTSKENNGETDKRIEGPKWIIPISRESISEIKNKNKSFKTRSILGPKLENVITKYYGESNRKIKESGHLGSTLKEEQSDTNGVHDKEKFSVSSNHSSEEESKRRGIVSNNQPV